MSKAPKKLAILVGGGPAPGGDGGGNGEPADDDVIDAEYVDVDGKNE